MDRVSSQEVEALEVQALEVHDPQHARSSKDVQDPQIPPDMQNPQDPSDKEGKGMDFGELRSQILEARNRQAHRFKSKQIHGQEIHGQEGERVSRSGVLTTNSTMTALQVKFLIKKHRDVDKILNQAMSSLDLSMRARHRLLKVAQTIADLEESHQVTPYHIAEALMYRPKRMAKSDP
jgi:magnesium chelatase family protein